MKTLTVGLNREGLNLRDDDKAKSDVELCTNVIKNVILAWGVNGNRRGLGEEDRRKYYKICDTFDAAVKENKAAIELEDDHMGLIRKVFRETDMMPDKLLRQVEEAVAAVKDR